MIYWRDVGGNEILDYLLDKFFGFPVVNELVGQRRNRLLLGLESWTSCRLQYHDKVDDDIVISSL